MSPSLRSPLPLPTSFRNIRVVATDMDGTLTREGKFSAQLLNGLSQLRQAGFQVLIVTGRSAGWVNGLVSYLPVAGAIAENGGLYYPSADQYDILPSIADIAQHRQQLATTFQRLKRTQANLKESLDNQFRLTDWTFDVAGLSQDELERLRYLCEADHWSFTYSTVQCHIKVKGQDKSHALVHVLETHFPDVTSESVLTIGDSPNDESLFNQDIFPQSIGVANVRHYLKQLTHQPTYMTSLPEVDGFNEVVRSLL